MKKLLFLFSLMMCATMVCTAVGCSDDKESSSASDASSSVDSFLENSADGSADSSVDGSDSVAKSIAITGQPANATLEKGESCMLGYTLSPEGVSLEVQWQSSNPEVASVSNAGELSALSAGETIISVTVKGTAIKDQFALSVEEPVIPNPATALEIVGVPEATVRVGATPFNLTVNATLEDSSLPCTDTYVWTSNNTAVATVNEHGQVTPLKVGSATIKVAVVGNTEQVFDEYVLNVYPQIPADGVYVDTLKNVSIGDAFGAMTVDTLDADILYGGTRYQGVSHSLDTTEGYEGSLLVSGGDLRNYDRTFFELKYDDILDSEKEYVISASVTLVNTENIEVLKTAQWMLCWWDTDRTSALSAHDATGESCTCMSCVPQSGYAVSAFEQIGDELIITIKTDKPIRGLSFGLMQSEGANTNYVVRFNYIKFIEYAEVEGLEITKDGEAVGADLAFDVKDLGETPWTLTLGHQVSNTPSPYDLVWESSNESVATVENGVVTILKTGLTEISVRVKGESASAAVSLTVKDSSIVNVVEEINVINVPETMKVGQIQAIEIETKPMDCTEFGLVFEYTQPDVIKVEQTAEGYQLVALKEGTSDITVFVDGIEDVDKTFTVTVSGDVDIQGAVQTETFQRGKVMETYYEGPFVNVGSRANSSTMNAVTVNEDGFVWSSATTGDGRIMFRYNGYDGLDFTGGKKYAIRVALTTPANYPDAGYIMVYGFKAEACDSYKIANAGTDKIVTSEGGSTARKVLGGKNMTTYFDFILDGTQSSEFFIAYHSASNSGKVGMTADVTVSKVEIIDLSAYEALGATETFEEDTVSVSGLSYTGTNFDVIAAAGDMMSIANHPAPQLSMYTSGKGLYWVSPRVWKEGLQTNDEGNEVTHNAKLVFTYKGEYDADGSYRIRIPLYMKANTPDQVKTTKVKLFYATAGTYSEKLLETKTIGWTQTASVFEVVIPAGSNWNGQLVMRMYNDEITANSAGSKMLCYFDGVSLEQL